LYATGTRSLADLHAVASEYGLKAFSSKGTISRAGIHDMLFAACDPARYEHYGVPGHPSCADNLRKAMARLGYDRIHIPQPANFFMNVAVLPDGRVDFRPPLSKAGDWVLLKAMMDAIFAISACPQEFNPANNYNPTDLLAKVLIRQ
jgi:uncharacterized protein YcgI (DUF1989 family)